MRAALRDDDGADAEDMKFKKRNTRPKSKGTSKGPTPDELEAEDQEIRDVVQSDLEPGSSRPGKGKGRSRGRGRRKRQLGKDSGLNHWNLSMYMFSAKGVLSTAFS